MAKSERCCGAARRAAVRAASISLGGLAVAGVALLGLTPTVAAAATRTFFVRGTDTGYFPPDAVWQTWVDETVGAVCGDHEAPTMIDYPAAFWPVSNGFFGDPRFGDSIADGVAGLAASLAGGDGTGVIIHGYSQGAAVATEYLRAHPGEGNTYILAANPNRPNGGILNRFAGMYIPILDVSFNGSTPTGGETVIDIARQYDGWADFPKYPLNLVATANALLGIAFLHGQYNNAITPEVLAGIEPTTHGNTSYYLVPTERLPLLMPLTGILPDDVLDALDGPLRAFIETAYDRADYGVPTAAGLVPGLSPAATGAAPSEATAQDSEDVSPESEQEPVSGQGEADEPGQKRRAGWTPRPSLSAPAHDDAADTSVDDSPQPKRGQVRPTREPREPKKDTAEPENNETSDTVAATDTDSEPPAARDAKQSSDAA
ncbi:hypothetical protein BH10ACT9_BH10ACT9_09040 [soil metagenome]